METEECDISSEPRARGAGPRPAPWLPGRRGPCRWVARLGVCLAMLGVVGSTAVRAMSPATAGPPPMTAPQGDRDAVHRAARQALPDFLKKIPRERIKEYGFRDEAQFAQASVQTPFPLHMPARNPDALTRQAVEKIMSEQPASWLAPVVLGNRVVALINVDKGKTGEIEVTGFGSTFRAGRIAAGLHAAGRREPGQWSGVELVAFYEPHRELLLTRARGGRWQWFALDGIDEGRAARLSDAGIQAFLDDVRSHPPVAPVAPPSRPR